jgi:hypothetical protein
LREGFAAGLGVFLHGLSEWAVILGRLTRSKSCFAVSFLLVVVIFHFKSLVPSHLEALSGRWLSKTK